MSEGTSGDITDQAKAKMASNRRDVLSRFAGIAALGAAVSGIPSAAQTSDPTAAEVNYDIFSFLLNIKYLQASYYSFALSGSPLAASDTTGGVGTLGAALGGRAVAFRDPLLAQHVRDIAADEIAQLRFLRSQFRDSTRVTQPAIDLSVGSTSAFGVLGNAAGLSHASGSFDPYSTDELFLLGAFFFKDVCITAYKGFVPLIRDNRTLIEAASGLMATEAYHAGTIRSKLYRRSLEVPSLQLSEAATAISNIRDTFDGDPAADAVRGISPDDDQGIASTITIDGVTSNVTPLNENGIAFSRSAGQVLNTLYLNDTSVSRGGFFPAGINGDYNTSAP